VRAKHCGGLCVLWAGVIYASAFLFASKPQIFCSLSSFLKAQTTSTSRSTDYLIWFACRGFHLFAFSILTLLLLSALKFFKTWPIAVFLPTLAFAFLEQMLRHQRWPTIIQPSMLLIDAVGVALGTLFFVKHHVRIDAQAMISS
jgi:hypothetical protein